MWCALQPHDLVSRTELSLGLHTALCLLAPYWGPAGRPLLPVTVIDRGPFTGAFLDLSPVAASALGCRCAHRNVTGTVVQMGSSGTVASRGHQRPVVAAVMTIQPTGDVTRPLGMFGSTMAKTPTTPPRSVFASTITPARCISTGAAWTPARCLRNAHSREAPTPPIKLWHNIPLLKVRYWNLKQTRAVAFARTIPPSR